MTITGSNRTTPTRMVALLAYDGCQGSAIGSLIEVLDIANLYASRGDAQALPLFQWTIVSPDGKAPTAMGGVSVAVMGAPQDVPAPDLIYIPGLHFTGDSGHFLQQVRAVAGSCGEWLLKQHREGRAVAFSCAWAFIAAETGLLDGRRAATSWWLGKLFRATYPRVGFCEGRTRGARRTGSEFRRFHGVPRTGPAHRRVFRRPRARAVLFKGIAHPREAGLPVPLHDPASTDGAL